MQIKRTFAALCLFCTFAAAPAAVYGANSEGLTGTELLALCNSTYDTDYGFCAGYISGIANALLAGPVAGETSCNHSPVRSEQLIDIYRNYAEVFPGNMKGSAAKTAAAAIARAFPCH